MNPKLTITVDAKNRALSVASGMITVGAKIDVEISGLPGDIPPWGADDAFSGPSVRFRLVDEFGRDLARYPLAEGDRWEPSGGVLSSQTPVEFDTERLRCAFRGIAFDDTLPFGVVVDSAVDAAQYAVGRVKVRQWAAASTEDPTILPDWRETLERLQKGLSEVSEKRDDAVAAKAAAESAASEAQSSRNEAAASALAASSANDMAHASASDANNAKAAAQKAKTDAEAARDRAEAASGDFDGRLKDYAKKSEVKEEVDAANAAIAAAVAKEVARAKEAEAKNARRARTAATQATTAYDLAYENKRNKADKATTLAGYGITDAATKAELSKKQDELTENSDLTVNTLGLKGTPVQLGTYYTPGTDYESIAVLGSTISELTPDGSPFLTKAVGDTLYATLAQLALKADKTALDALAAKVDAANAALEGVA